MIVSITKIELVSYSKLIEFFKFNVKVIDELKHSKCQKFKMTSDWNLKVWYTMTLWVNEADMRDFYTQGTHLEAMRQSRHFSSKIKSSRIQSPDLLNWREAKRRMQV